MSLTVLHHMEGGKEIIQKVKKGKEMDHTQMQGGKDIVQQETIVATKEIVPMKNKTNNSMSGT